MMAKDYGDSMTFARLKELAKSPEEALHWLMKEAEAANNETEQQQAAKLLDYYIGTQTEHMKEWIEKNYPKTFENVMPSLEVSNIARAVTDRLSVIYNETPVREVMIGKETSENDQTLYDDIIRMGMLDTKADILNRLNTLTGTMHMRFWVDIDGDLQFEPVDRTRIYAVPNKNNPTKADSVYYLSEGKDDNGDSCRIISYWDREHYIKFRKPKHGNVEIIQDPDNPEFINHYGVIPFVRLDTSIDQTDYFCDVPDDLLNCQENVNNLITALNNCLKFQMFSVPVFIGDPPEQVTEMGESVPVVIPQSPDDMQPAEFRWETPSPKIEETTKEITQKMVRFARSMGLPDNTFSISASDVSGVSLYIQHESIRSHIKRQKTYFEFMEMQLFEVVKAVWNYEEQFLDKDHPLKGRKFNEKARLDCRIIETKTQKTPEQVTAEWQFLLENRLKSPVDYYVEVEGMTRDEAEQKAEAVRLYYGAQPMTAPGTTPAIIEQT